MEPSGGMYLLPSFIRTVDENPTIQPTVQVAPEIEKIFVMFKLYLRMHYTSSPLFLCVFVVTELSSDLVLTHLKQLNWKGRLPCHVGLLYIQSNVVYQSVIVNDCNTLTPIHSSYESEVASALG